MNNLFVYGTLMNEEVLTSLLKCNFKKKRALLSGYGCFSVSGKNYPAIRPERESVVTGVLINNLTLQHLEILDKFEGVFYQRITVEVEANDNNKHQCETYTFKPEYYNLLTKTGWSNENFRKIHMKSFINRL